MAVIGVAGGLGWAALTVPTSTANLTPLGIRGEVAAVPTGSAVAGPAISAQFGLCHVGGGTNCVVDGDTFWVGGEKVRIAGIDAPETHPARCPEEERLGHAATMRLQQLLNAGPFVLTPIDRDRDRYGRLLRDVRRGGGSVGDTLIAEGLARAYGGGRRPWC